MTTTSATSGVAQEHVLDLGRRNVFPTANDGVVGPSGDEEKPHEERARVVGHQLRELLITETVIQWHQRYAGASGGKQGWGEGRAVHPQNRSLRVLVALAEQGAAGLAGLSGHQRGRNLLASTIGRPPQVSSTSSSGARITITVVMSVTLRTLWPTW